MTSSRGRASARSELEDVAEPVVALGALCDVRRPDRDLCLHRLQHGVAPNDPFGSGSRTPGLGRRCAQSRSVLARVLRPIGNVIRPVLCLGRRALCLPGLVALGRPIRPYCLCPYAALRPCAGYCPASLAPTPLRRQVGVEGPTGAIRSIGNLDAKVSERAPDRVGSGEVLTISGCSALFQQLVDQGVDQPSSAGRYRSSRPRCRHSSPRSSACRSPRRDAGRSDSRSSASRAWLPSLTALCSTATAARACQDHRSLRWRTRPVLLAACCLSARWLAQRSCRYGPVRPPTRRSQHRNTRSASGSAAESGTSRTARAGNLLITSETNALLSEGFAHLLPAVVTSALCIQYRAKH